MTAAVPSTSSGQVLSAYPEPGIRLGTAAVPLDTAINRALALGVGFLLAVLTLQTQYIGTPTDLLSRIAPVDMLCVVFISTLFVRHRMRPVPAPALLYAAAVVLALIPAVLITPGFNPKVWAQFAGILMAFAFYVIGLNVGDSPALLRWLLAGLCVAVIGEAVIVYHDTFSSSLWFPDPMANRVRGTFKTNGQLGAYAFCAAAFLVTFGATVTAPKHRKIFAAASLVAASFVFFASRRMGMLAVFAWGALFAVLGARFTGRRFYNGFLAGLAGVVVLIAAFWPQIEGSFVGRRFRDAVDTVGKREGFIQDQMSDCLRTASEWFPLGFGVGRGSRVDPNDFFEVHNGLLAVLVELGVLGFAGFVGMTLWPLIKRRWYARSFDHQRLGVLLTTTLLISVLFMFHNTLYRDRAFLLFLGVATAVVARESQKEGEKSDLFLTGRVDS